VQILPLRNFPLPTHNKLKPFRMSLNLLRYSNFASRISLWYVAQESPAESPLTPPPPPSQESITTVLQCKPVPSPGKILQYPSPLPPPAQESILKLASPPMSVTNATILCAAPHPMTPGVKMLNLHCRLEKVGHFVLFSI
jgi:hypothetical protein